MSKAQKIALVLIWLGILGTIGAVRFSWRVHQEWLSPWGYMTVRHNLLTAEEDVWVGDQWVPLPQRPRRPPQVLGESPRQRVSGLPPATPDEPLPPLRSWSPHLAQAPPRATPRAAAPAPPRARVHAPVSTTVTPAPPPPPAPEAAAPPVEDDGFESALIDPDIPIVRAPSPDPLPEPEAPPPASQVASADDNAPAVSVPDPAQQAAAPAVCDPAVPGTVC